METNNILIKGLIIAGLILAMLIPIELVKGLISEREENNVLVEQDISAKWGGCQQVTGPILVLPYTAKEQILISIGSADKTTVQTQQQETTKHAYFLPNNLSVDGNINTEERARTLYKSLVYQSNLKIGGSFSFPNYEELNIKQEDIKWDEVFFLINIPGLQGVKNKIDFKVNGEILNLQAGVPKNDLMTSGISIKMPLSPSDKKDKYDFDFNLVLNGTNNLSVTPIGKETQVSLESEWKTVSFTGDNIPSERNLENGFKAKWNIFDYNRNYSQMWTGANDNLYSSSLGVDLRFAVNQYQMSMRAVKYAIMFIALTFVIFFLIELLSNKRIHPMQYFLVSFALLIFYTLLLALSEHIGFELSYLISAIAIIGLVSGYSLTIFNSKKQAILLGIFLTILYIFLYVILQLEDLALLFGSIGLFIALAAIMYVSRKVNWYNLGNKATPQNTHKIPPVYIPLDKGVDSDK